MRKLLIGSIVAGLCALMVSPASADNRASASKKGSLLVYSAVELGWDAVGNLTTDTIIDLSNDYPGDVDVQLYFCNGDEPLDAVFVGDPPLEVERAHPGWNCVDCQITLTANQPTYMSLFEGGLCQPFTVLDPGSPNGRPAGFNGDRALRGFVYAWAVDANGEEIRWNHLSGSATTLDFSRTTAWEYGAMAFQACPGDSCANGAATDATPGQLLLDGSEYDIAFDKLLFDFYAAGSGAFSGDGCDVIMDTDLTLHPLSGDFRQDTNGPITTKAKFDIWNQNEIRFSGTEKCVTCWDQTLLSEYDDPNHMLIGNLQTDKGKARIDGMGSTQCPFSVDAAILGVAAKNLVFVCSADGSRGGYAQAGRNLVGQGEEAATILWDIIAPPTQAQDGTGFAPARSLKNSSRSGR